MPPKSPSALQRLSARFASACVDLGAAWLGRRVHLKDAPWLECPMGPDEQIGPQFYDWLADNEELEIRPDASCGLLRSFDDLRGPRFNPDHVAQPIRDFYEQTARHELDAWSETRLGLRIGLWCLTHFVSHSIDQFNFPLSAMELSRGMTSEVLPMVERSSGKHRYTGWLRRRAVDGRVLYAGLYSAAPAPGYGSPCVKVSFPVPRGSIVVFLRPEAMPDGSFKLISAGSKFGDVGFYRLVRNRDGWDVVYLPWLKEEFHLYVKDGFVRTDHAVRIGKVDIFRLHYKIRRLHAEEESADADAVVAAREM